VWGILRAALKAGVASLALGVVVYAVIHWPGFYAGRMTQKAAALAATILAGTATYFAGASLLNIRELGELRAVRGVRAVGSELD